MKQFADMPLSALLKDGGLPCNCGREHTTGLRYLRVGRGAVGELPNALETLGLKKPYVVFDQNTKAAAWQQVKAALEGAGIPYVTHELVKEHLEPDEHAVGSLCMAFDPSCDVVLAVGSGVINDCCKVLAHTAGKPSMVVGTAPSMDGYASNSSSMIQDRVKATLINACPVAVIADTDIMCQAPEKMLWAGLGDMLAKYVALCEWRISHLVIGEYYCPNVAGLMRASLQKVVDAAPRLMERDPDATAAVAEGLVLSGIAMAFAKISRPASGLEHYFSHMWEMMALDRGRPYELHGIQVGVGTLLTLRIYDKLRTMRPSMQTAENFMNSFSQEWWTGNVRRIFGKAAVTILKKAEAEGKNDPQKQHERAKRIVENWDEILTIIDEELPKTSDVEALMKRVKMPMLPSDLGISEQDVRDAFTGSRDSRDKYLTSSMLWDLGLLYTFELPL